MFKLGPELVGIFDVIVEFNGKPVPDSRQLRLMVSHTAPGTRVEVKVLRQGKAKTFTVTLKEMPAPKSAQVDRGPEESDDELKLPEESDEDPEPSEEDEPEDDGSGGTMPTDWPIPTRCQAAAEKPD